MKPAERCCTWTSTHLKKVNDLHGHEIGDRLLVEVSARLRGTLRKGDYISRLGEDEFTVILASSKAPHAERVAGKIIERLSRPYSILVITIDFISASVGVSVFPQDGRDARTLLKHADEAMYRAKIHKGCFVRYGRVSGLTDRKCGTKVPVGPKKAAGRS